MRRRRILQMGVAAALPLAGCGTSAPDAKMPPPDPRGGGGEAAGRGAAKEAGEPRTAATASHEAGPAASGEAGKGTGSDAALNTAEAKAPESTFSRVIAKVGKNHGHVFSVAFADVVAGAEKTYDLTGTGGHPHSVTLSADDMKSLSKGQIVRTRSTKGLGHAHRVLVRCAPAVDPPEWVSVCYVEFSGKDEHEMVIPAADVAAKATRTYDVQGIAGHPHELQVTATDFEKLLKGEAVSLLTTRDESDAHLHTVFIQYRPPKKA
jgi:hypothetical protein